MDFVREVKLLAAQARRKDRKMRLFGASSHKYDFAPTISIDKLRKFEGEYHIKLPENFARYLTEVGNGGAGPGYGIYSLEKLMKYNQHWISAYSEEIFFDRENKTEEWIKMCEQYEQAEEAGDPNSECERIYKKMVNGALIISTPGCTMYTILMCKGKNYGKVGIIDTDMVKEYEPHLFEKTFEEWLINGLRMNGYYEF